MIDFPEVAGRYEIGALSKLVFQWRKPMKNVKVMALAMAGLAFFAAGSCRVMASEAQSATPPAYYVAEFEVTDPEGMKPYSAHVEATFKPYGGHFIVRGGKTISLEGVAPKRRRVVIEFASVEKARAWYNSAEYTELRKIRQRSAKTDVYLIEGVSAQ